MSQLRDPQQPPSPPTTAFATTTTFAAAVTDVTDVALNNGDNGSVTAVRAGERQTDETSGKKNLLPENATPGNLRR